MALNVLKNKRVSLCPSFSKVLGERTLIIKIADSVGAYREKDINVQTAK